MASDKFEVGDILVCVDGSAHGGYGEGLKVGKIYEVERPNGSGECYLVGNWHSWFSRRFRRATLAEIRKYRKEQGYEKHQFAIGELVVGIAQDSLLPVIGQTHVVSATQSDDEHECFIDIDGGKDPGQHFAAKFRKATPAEAAAYRKANEPPKNGASADSIDSVEVGDVIVFVGPSNKNGREYGTIATVQGVIYKSGNEVHELRIHVPGEGWTYVTPHSWVPVGRGYELVALGQPMHTGDEWLEAGQWVRTRSLTEMGHYKLIPGILRRKVKDAVTVQIGDMPPFKAAVLDPPTFNLTFTWEGPEKMPLTGNDSPEAINKAISVPNPQTLTSADGREFDIIDWNPKVKTGEVVTVEANLLVKQAKEKSKSFADGLVGAATPKKPQWEPKAGDIVVCIDLLNTSPFHKDLLVQGKTYRIKQVGSLGALEIEGVSEYWHPSRFRLATPAEAQAFLDAEKQPPKDPGIGYRFLDKAELVVEGDEYWSPYVRAWKASGHWQPSQDKKQAGNMTYRRRNQFAEGELVQIIKPATQALRDAYPGWVTRGGENMDGLDGTALECPPSRALSGGQRGINVELGRWWTVDVDWLAPASSRQKAAFQAEKAKKAAFQAEKDKKAKVQELEDKMKAIESELAILKGT